MADASPREVEIFVKNVYAQAESQQLTVSEAITVRMLKEMLHQQMPSRPPPVQQKIIFGGKICEDDHPLSRVLAGPNQAATPFVFHLMVPSAIPKSRPPTPEPKAPTPTATTVAPTQPIVTPTPTPTPTQMPFMGFFHHPPPTPTTDSPHQHQHDQQLYMQAMLMQQQAMLLSQIQYLQQLKAYYDHHSGSTPTPPAATPGPQHQHQPQNVHFGHYFAPPVHNNAPPAAAVPADAPPRERGPVAQALREILPLLDPRLAMKMAFMLFIIGQDTPIDRLVVLVLMSFVAYLHITGILGKVLGLIQRAQTNATNATNANNANADNANADTNNQRASLTRFVRIASDRGLVHDVRYFVTGLLLSLVPAWHPQPLHGDVPQQDEPRVPDADIPLQGI